MIALVAVAALAAGHDIRYGRIPNRLTVGGFAIGMALSAASGWGVALDHLLAATVALALGVVLFSARVLGGGDVKLIVAVAALVGPSLLPTALLLACAAGGALALITCVRRGILLPVVLNCRDMLVFWASLGRTGKPLPAASGTARTIPYGVAVGLGAVLACLL